MSSPQPKLKLYYFNMTGKAEPIRLLCAFAGLALEDYRFASRQEFTDMKKDLTFGQVPMLEVTQPDGTKHQLVQSHSILNYLAKLGGLYPSDDPLLAAKVDAALAQEADAFIGPTIVSYSSRFGIPLSDEAKEQSKELIVGTVMPSHLEFLERLLQTSGTGWIAGTKDPSPADFAWFVRLTDYMPKAGYLPSTMLDPYPGVKAFAEKFGKLDAIVKYQSQ